MSRLVVEIELIDGEEFWRNGEMEELADRVRTHLIWHGIAKEAFCELGKITARKG
jgi:hypothetical protein